MLPDWAIFAILFVVAFTSFLGFNLLGKWIRRRRMRKV